MTSQRPSLRALALLSVSSGASIVAGLVSGKLWALLLGPASYGLLALAQSLVTVGAMVGEIGVSVGLVRRGAQLVREDAAAARRLWAGATLAVVPSLAIIAVTLIAGRGFWARLVLGSSELGAMVPWCVVAIALTVLASIHIGVLTAHHRVGALARFNTLSAVLSPAVMLGVAVPFGVEYVAAALATAALARLALAAWELRAATGELLPPPSTRGAVREASQLLRFGVPYAASALAGAGVQHVVPILVLNAFDETTVGWYSASYAISATSVGFLLAAFGQDYYPRVSAARDDDGQLRDLVNSQHELLMVLGLPVLLTAKALSFFVLPVLYSPAFAPAVQILEWQLVADLVRFSSWTMSFVVLARCSSLTFLAGELFAGVTLLASLWACARLFGHMGLGIGFVPAYAAYWLFMWGLSRRAIGLIWQRKNLALLIVGLVGATLPETLSVVVPVARKPVAIGVAVIAIALSGRSLAAEVRRRWTRTHRA